MELKLFLTELQPFKLSHFGSFLQCWVWSLYPQIFSQFSMDVSQILCRHVVDILKMCMYGFDGARISF